MPEYLSSKKRKQSIGINSYSEYTDTTKIIGNVLVGFGSVGVGTTVPTQDVDVNTIRVRDTLFDYTNSGGEFGYYLVKDTGGIKWVAVPPIDSNAIFIAENNNILGVSSFTGLNIISDELISVTPNTINPNFADITIVPRWLKSGETGIYTTKNVGIGTTIPTTDFQVGFGTTGVTIDGSVGVVSALGYYGNYAFIDQITVNDQLNVVGLGSTLVAAFLGSGGGITTTGGDLYVGGTLFADKLDIINLEVVNINATGITTLNVGIVSTFRVTGVSTLGVTSTKDLFVDANLRVSGITTLGITSTKDLYVDENLYVVGIATATRFSTGATGSAINITSDTISGPAEIIIDPADVGNNSGAVRIKGDLFVDGEEFIVNSTTIELADFNVGIASTVGTNFLLDGAGIGIGSTNIRKTLTYDFSSDALKSSENFDLETGKVYKINETEVLSSTLLTVANINATGVSTLGFATIGQLYVSGVSTFVGVGTFINDLYVGGDLYVADDIFFDELNAKNANITGITTLNVGIVSTFRVTGVSTLGVTSISQLYVSGVSTFVGVGTFINDLYVGEVLYADVVTGLTSTTDLLVDGDLRVTGITTLGVTTTTNLTSQQLYVSGLSTFVGVGTFSGDLYVSDILYADVVTGLTSTTDLLVDGNLRVTGISTLGVTTISQLNVSGITTLGVTTISQLNVSGITTLGVTSTTNLTSQQLIVSGITTLGVTSTTNLTSQQLNVSGITTLGITTAQQLYVSGVSTFVGVGTFIDDLYVGKVLYAKTVDFDNIEVENIKATGISTLNVGIVSTLTVTGVSTLGVTSATNLTSQQLNVSGITTLGITTLEQLYVSGVSTFVGVGTFSGNLYVGGDLYVADDLVFDEFTARNINVTGISSLNVGIVSTLTVSGISTLGVTSATNLTSQQLNVAGILTASRIVGTSLSISGISTIANFLMTPVGTGATVGGIGVTYYGDGSQLTKISSSSGYADTAGIATNVIGGIASVTSLNVTGITTLASIVGTSLSITGITTLGVTSTTNLTTQQLLVTGITTLASIVGTSLSISGISTLGVTSTTNLTSQQLNVSGITTLGVTSTTNLTSQQLNVSGITTLGVTSTTNLTTQQLLVTGITTLASIVGTSLSISGISTIANFRITNVGTGATVGGIGVTYYGDGSKLTNIDPSALSGIVTYADRAGIATNVIGGIGSISQLQVTGISTFTNGPILVGSATSTGTALQRLQVTGGAYISGNLGIGTTNPTTKLYIDGDTYVTGVVTATTFIGNLTGTASIASSVTENSVGLGTDTFGDYVKDITGTANQITVTAGTGEGSTPILSIPNQFTAPQDVTVSRDLQVNRNLNVNGNITIGGTAATLFTQTFKVADADIILGVRTDGNGNDISTDNTANHGGIAIASTDGNPLIILTNQGIGETLPATYKKIMWFKEGSFAGLGTDAWLSNYALGVGTTELQAGTVLAAGSVQFSKDDLKIVRNINASGIITATEFKGTLTGYASSAGIATHINGGAAGNVVYQSAPDTTTFVNNSSAAPNQVLLWNGSAPVWEYLSIGSVAGIVTYAERAGIAVTVIGGIASVTSLNVTGITTLASIVGTSLSISGISTLGITSTTNLTSQQLLVTGITTLASIVGTSLSITGISTIANFIMTPVGTGATVGGIGVVTYYGDGSGLTKINSSAIVGVSTYADIAGIATNVIGGIGSITQLQVTGVSTFTNGPILVGSATSTGTASQRLQVTGGAYVSGNLGIGTTDPTTKLDVDGDIRLRFGLYDNNNLTGDPNSILVSTGTGVTWSTLGNLGGSDITIQIDESTPEPQYLVFTNATSGSTYVEKVSPTKLTYIASSGNLGIGTSIPSTPLSVELYGVKTGFGTFVASAGITTDVDNFLISDTNFKTAEYTVHIESSTSIQAQKVLVMQNGINAFSQEYGIMYDPTFMISIGATVSGGRCKLQFTPESGISGLMTYRFTRETIK